MSGLGYVHRGAAAGGAGKGVGERADRKRQRGAAAHAPARKHLDPRRRPIHLAEPDHLPRPRRYSFGPRFRRAPPNRMNLDDVALVVVTVIKVAANLRQTSTSAPSAKCVGSSSTSRPFFT